MMRSTRRRPVGTGRVSASSALWFGTIAGVVAFMGMGVLVNWTTAAALLSGYIFYVFIYTIWFKRRSVQNSVIGGAAGELPPVVGWTVVTVHLALDPILRFLLIFMWTPPHFWSLALYKQEDYKNAGIPMMPVMRGVRTTKVEGLIYAVAAVLVSVGLYMTRTVSVVYLVTAVAVGVVFLIYNIKLLQESASEFSWSQKTFRFSLVYIAFLFVAMVV